MTVVCIARWGPAAWFTLHSMAHTSPVRMTQYQSDRFRDLLYHFADFLPCLKCARHMRRYLDAHFEEHAVRSRAEAVELLNDLHNSVNARTGKPCWTLAEHHAWMAREGMPSRSGSLSGGSISAPVVIAVVASVLLVATKVWTARGLPTGKGGPTVS